MSSEVNGAQGEKRDGAANNSSEIMMGEEMSMNRIIDFLREQQKSTYTRETDFIFEKQQMQLKINQLNAQLRAQENINNDLIRRIKMLEFSLRQERIKYAKLAQSHNLEVQQIGNTDIIGQALQKANMNVNLYERVAKRKAKAQRPFLLKFLQEIGYDDIFNVDEVNEIKNMYDKAQQEMKDAFETEMAEQDASKFVQKLEDKLLKSSTVAQEEDDQIDSAFEVIDVAKMSKLKNSSKPRSFTPKFTIKSHYGMVTDMHYSEQLGVLTSVSDDCQVHLWNMAQLQKADISEVTFHKEQPFFSLRGHKKPVYAVTGVKLVSDEDLALATPGKSQVDKLIFTAGEEGLIKIWMIPAFEKYDKFPLTNGRTYCVGEWSQGSATEEDTIISLKYNPLSKMLAAAKIGGQVEIWDCKEQIKKAEVYTQDDLLQCKEDFSRLDDPYMQNTFTIENVPQQCTAIQWLPTEQSVLACALIQGQVALLDTKVNAFDTVLEVSQSTIVCMTAHEFKTLIVTGHEDNDIIVTDFKTQQQVCKLELEAEAMPNSLLFVNNGLTLLVGLADGSIAAFETNTWKLQSMVKNAHLSRDQHGMTVNCMIKAGTDKQTNAASAVPLVLTGGSDGIIRIFEHNPYFVRDGNAAPSILSVSQKLDAEQLRGMNRDELSQLFREQVSDQIKKHQDDSGEKAEEVIEKLLTSKVEVEVDGDKKESDEWKFDLVKLLTEQDYLNRSYQKVIEM